MAALGDSPGGCDGGVADSSSVQAGGDGALTYNLYLGFRAQALGNGWEHSQVQTVRWRLFQTPGKIVRHGRQMFLKISTAMFDMFAAIRERCACIMREGGAILETS